MTDLAELGDVSIQLDELGRLQSIEGELHPTERPAPRRGLLSRRRRR